MSKWIYVFISIDLNNVESFAIACGIYGNASAVLRFNFQHCLSFNRSANDTLCRVHDMWIPFDRILRHRTMETMRNFIKECMHLCVEAAYFSLVKWPFFLVVIIFPSVQQTTHAPVCAFRVHRCYQNNKLAEATQKMNAIFRSMCVQCAVRQTCVKCSHTRFCLTVIIVVCSLHNKLPSFAVCMAVWKLHSLFPHGAQREMVVSQSCSNEFIKYVIYMKSLFNCFLKCMDL